MQIYFNRYVMLKIGQSLLLRNSQKLHIFLNLLLRVGGLFVTYKRVLDWMIGVIALRTLHSELQEITALSLSYTFYSSHASVLRLLHSPLVISWQRIHNSLTVSSNHT
jgi:hypothetical protein